MWLARNTLPSGGLAAGVRAHIAPGTLRALTSARVLSGQARPAGSAICRSAIAGGVPLTTLTPEEVVEHAVAVAGTQAKAPTALLAGLANEALFSPVPPGPDQAQAAGRAESEVRRLARHDTSIKTRSAVLLKSRPSGSLDR